MSTNSEERRARQNGLYNLPLAQEVSTNAEIATTPVSPEACREAGHGECETVFENGEWWTVHHPSEPANALVSTPPKEN